MKARHFAVLKIGDVVDATFGHERVRGRVKYKTPSGARVVPLNSRTAEFSAAYGRLHFPEERQKEIEERERVQALEEDGFVRQLCTRWSEADLSLLSWAHERGLTIPDIIDTQRTGRLKR